MTNAETAQQARYVVSMPRPQRVRLLVDDKVAPEHVHWALRVSFWALLSPSAWLKAYAPARGD